MSAASDTIVSLRNDGPKIIAVGAVMLALAVCSVILRLLAKAANEKEYGFDDLLIGCSLASYLASESLALRAVDVGRQAFDGASSQFATYMQLSWVYSFLYWSNIAFATLSILALYRRVFSTHRFFSVSSLVLVTLTVVWWISGSICDAISYRPAQAYWDPSVPGQYILNYDDFWIASMVAELLIEAAVLALPIREIIKLNLSARKKFLIASLFCMGGFVLITGIVRIYYSWAKSDMTPGTIWLSIHSAVAIVSACLPTYRPLLARLPGPRAISTRKDSYSRDYSSSNTKRSVKSLPSTKRSTPSAALNVAAAQEETRTSFDADLLGNRHNLEDSGRTSQSTIAEGSEKGLELQTINASQNGVTRKISVPSPTSTDEIWGPLGDYPTAVEVLHMWPLGNDGQRTKRAELEYKRNQARDRIPQET